ncbi:MAG: hypothetical protein M3317_07735, partial [Actinomycetota bacterium]|nr:hypothetical protein [Actinomycetota bacterium]
GHDTYFFRDGWGKDSITNETLSGSRVWFGSEIGEEPPVAENLIVDLVSGAGPEAKTADGTNTVNWGPNVVDDVSGGGGDDQITGNASANEITGQPGADTIFGAEGDDHINVNDGSLSDTAHCGAGEIRSTMTSATSGSSPTT